MRTRGGASPIRTADPNRSAREAYIHGPPIDPVANRTILVGMAATFVGLTALLVIAGIVVNPLLLVVAVPFGAVAYLLWYHASGKLRDRVRREAAGADAAERARARQRARAAEHRRGGASGTRANGAGRSGSSGGPRDWGPSGDPRDRAPSSTRMSERAAYETLGLDAAASQDAIRSAYRERAKRLHPDSDGGDEEAFKELNEAYEVLKRT
ncbi:hypothetical protein JCM18237_19270 [Halorubrum luteum]